MGCPIDMEQKGCESIGCCRGGQGGREPRGFGGRGSFDEKWVGGWGKKCEFWAGVPRKENKEKKGVGVRRDKLGGSREVEPRGYEVQTPPVLPTMLDPHCDFEVCPHPDLDP